MTTIRTTSASVIDAMLNGLPIKRDDLVLEPSAGTGILADGIRQRTGCTVHVVELNKACREELSKKQYDLVGCDFFLFEPKVEYDFVVGAPNFKDNVDCLHIMKMLDCVKPGGVVRSITSPFWMTGDT